ncbi:MAG: phosphoribosyltransferase [Minisyncoccia bacterium]
MNQIILKEGTASHIEIITYPDGQRNIKLDMNYFNPKEMTVIHCRIKSFAELELLFCIVAALRKNDCEIMQINFIYLFGLRSDRAFELGMPNYTRDVLSPIIKLLDCPFSLFIPHNRKYIKDNSVSDIRCDVKTYGLIIGGDSSSGCSLHFYKQRDSKGRISVSLSKNDKAHIKQLTGVKLLSIVDDLCDGGTTFIEEGKILKELYPDKSLELAVYHGIFSKGFDELLKYYDRIVTTNSYQDFDETTLPKQIEVVKVI